MDHSVFVGPYLECQNSKVPSERKITCCTNPACSFKNVFHAVLSKSLRGEAKFCSGCGGAFGEMTEPSEADKVNMALLRDQMKDALSFPYGDYFCKGKDYWTPNRKCNKKHYFEPHEEALLEMYPDYIVEDLAEFQEKFKLEIRMIEEAYGIENVRLKWGMMIYAC